MSAVLVDVRKAAAWVLAAALVVLGIAIWRSASRSHLQEVDAPVIVDQPTNPVVEPEGGPLGTAHAAVAPSRRELLRQWDRFNLTGAPPPVDFPRQVVILAGFGESGSCPSEYEHVAIDHERQAVALILDTPRGICTSDYNPRTIGVILDRRTLPAGPFDLYAPAGPVTVSVEYLSVPPLEPPGVAGSHVPGVELTLHPVPVPVDAELLVGVRNETKNQISSMREVFLERWAGYGYEPADHSVIDWQAGSLLIRPGEEKPLLSFNTAAYEIEPGWYRATLRAEGTSGTLGRFAVRRSFEVVDE